MQPLTELAQYGLIGVVILSMASLIYIVRMFLSQIRINSDRHLESYNKFNLSLETNTIETVKIREYLELRNGSLEREIKNLSEIIKLMINR